MKSFSTINEGGLEYLQFSILAGQLNHAVFTRHGGVSYAPFDSLNVSYGVGDTEEAIRDNRARIKKVLGLETMVSARQVHGNRVSVITEKPDNDYEIDGCDALVTNCRTGLMIQQADCQAVIFYDPPNRAVGVAHAGWRGSVAGIIGETVRAMSGNFGSDPALMLAAISPSLGPCCAEFVNYRDELPEWMHDYQVDNACFDFQAISKAQLQQAGLRSANITAADICTRCSPDYFSYRRRKATGRFATIVALSD